MGGAFRLQGGHWEAILGGKVPTKPQSKLAQLSHSRGHGTGVSWQHRAQRSFARGLWLFGKFPEPAAGR